MLNNRESALEVVEFFNLIQKSIRDFEGMLKMRLALFCSAQERGEDPVLRIPSKDGGPEIIVNKAMLAKFFHILHYKMPSKIENRVFNRNFPMIEDEEIWRKALKDFIEVANELKISHKEIPDDIKKWLYGKSLAEN